MLNVIAVVASGIFAKLAGFINQLVSVWLIASAAGQQGLEAIFLAIAFVGWFNLTLLGAQTAFPNLLIESKKDASAHRQLLIAGGYISLFGAIACILCSAILLYIIPQSSSIHSTPVIWAVAANATLILFSLSEQYFQAINKTYQFNLLSAIGSAISLFITWFAAYHRSDLSIYVIAYFASFVIPVTFATAIALLHFKGEGLFHLTLVRPAISRLIRTGNFSLGFIANISLKLSAPLLILDLRNYGSEIPFLGVSLRLSTVIISGASVVAPIIIFHSGTARSTQNIGALKRWRTNTILFASGGAVFVFFAIFIGGRSLLSIWTRGLVSPNSLEIFSLALFAALWTLEYIIYQFSATATNQVRGVWWLFWAESAFGLLLMWQFTSMYGGAVGSLLGLSIPMIMSIMILLRIGNV